MNTNGIKHIDLHMHSTVSDGTDTPTELLKRVKKAGIEVFSVTDHDDIAAFEELRPILNRDDPYYLAGAEFSCKDDGGKYHILGYAYDPDDEGMRDLTARLHALRMSKIHKRIDFLRDEFGFSFSEEDLAELLARRNPGKPHLGNLMVKYGYAKTKDEAITRYIDELHIQNAYADPVEVIRVILDAGGVPVLAHPIFGSGDQYIIGNDLEVRIQHLMDLGLMGIEAYYSGFSEAMTEGIFYFAEKYDLYVTAGSDYHGRIKKVRLGDTGLPDLTDAHPNLLRFLEEIVPVY